MTSVFDNFPLPPASAFLGWELLREDPDKGEVEIAFHPGPETLNPRGVIQGGFVAAMLDDTMGPALVTLTGGKVMASSIDMNVSFLRPARPGRLICTGRVLSLGKRIAFLEGELRDSEGRVLARATSSAVPMPFEE